MKEQINLVGKEQCTACGACKCVCPNKCIQMQADNYGCDYPIINNDACTKCGLCASVCPADKTLVFDAQPQTVYAAWNNDKDDRETSASGGVASAMYEYALASGIKTFGVVYTPYKTAEYKEIKTSGDIDECRNSKYVFSDITPVLPLIKQYIKSGEKVIAIALPCQAAAILEFIGGRHPNLIIVDIVCHGVCSVAYLNQHLVNIDKKKKAKTDKVFFRDPRYGTGKFVFSAYDNGRLIYKRGVYEDDVYQIGYHSALTYRENCYSCKYATEKRVGDITIADFSGLGRLAPFEYERKSISCVMVSSIEGETLVQDMVKKHIISVDKRPVKEAFDYEKMLKRPSIPHKSINVFKEAYAKAQDFDKSAKKALNKDIRRNKRRQFLHVDSFRRILAKCTPKKLKQIIKRRRKK